MFREEQSLFGNRLQVDPFPVFVYVIHHFTVVEHDLRSVRQLVQSNLTAQRHAKASAHWKEKQLASVKSSSAPCIFFKVVASCHSVVVINYSIWFSLLLINCCFVPF